VNSRVLLRHHQHAAGRADHDRLPDHADDEDRHPAAEE
jgi:hypothetical protein